VSYLKPGVNPGIPEVQAVPGLLVVLVVLFLKIHLVISRESE